MKKVTFLKIADFKQSKLFSLKKLPFFATAEII